MASDDELTKLRSRLDRLEFERLGDVREQLGRLDERVKAIERLMRRLEQRLPREEDRPAQTPP